MPNCLSIEAQRLQLVPLNFESNCSGSQQGIEKRMSLELAGMILNGQVDGEMKQAMRTSLENIIRDKKHDQWFIDWQSVLIILKKRNEIIGGFCFQRHPDENAAVQVGYMINSEYQGNGYMTEALQRGVLWIFERPDIKSVLAETSKSNIASQRVLQKAGMTAYAETPQKIWWILRKAD